MNLCATAGAPIHARRPVEFLDSFEDAGEAQMAACGESWKVLFGCSEPAAIVGHNERDGIWSKVEPYFCVFGLGVPLGIRERLARHAVQQRGELALRWLGISGDHEGHVHPERGPISVDEGVEGQRERESVQHRRPKILADLAQLKRDIPREIGDLDQSAQQFTVVQCMARSWSARSLSNLDEVNQ
ncbi:hypothetical protein SPF06_03070 [Sinomonas sp. JGH33]|uniref:Uncharacterized protein n=1 Tax=Sinomonas terricola TaxID=3110330 RepID=A0ABU5T215_9MICC|nr:hypothetical protein [Sinomonas sp. JGH33]MEA5453694.1 hypothetical protein [Sinomonas sp. JGH33]